MRGPAAELAARFAEPPKGEITLVVGAGARRPSTSRRALAAVAELVAAGAPRGAAAEVVARLTGRRAERALPRHAVTTL